MKSSCHIGLPNHSSGSWLDFSHRLLKTSMPGPAQIIFNPHRWFTKSSNVAHQAPHDETLEKENRHSLPFDYASEEHDLLEIQCELASWLSSEDKITLDHSNSHHQRDDPSTGPHHYPPKIKLKKKKRKIFPSPSYSTNLLKWTPLASQHAKMGAPLAVCMCLSHRKIFAKIIWYDPTVSRNVHQKIICIKNKM